MPHNTPRIEEVIEREVTEAKFRKAMTELRRQRGKLLSIDIPPDCFRPIVLSVLGVTKPQGLPEDRERDWQKLMEIIDHTGKPYGNRSAGMPTLCSTRLRISRLARQPELVIPGRNQPATGRVRPTAATTTGRGTGGTPSFAASGHTLQERTGKWLRWFAGKSGSRQFLEKYLPNPYFPTSADLRPLF